MNDIEELLRILESLGSSASIEVITKEYCKYHHMIFQQQYKAIIESTLKRNSSRAWYDDITKEWCVLKDSTEVKKYNPNNGVIPIGEGLIGSPEWFYEKSQEAEMLEFVKELQELRKTFISSFSPERLEQMSGTELLNTVFSDKGGMLYQLTMDDTYRKFGAGSKFAYLWPLRYFSSTGECVTYSKSSSIPVIKGEEERAAVKVRDELLVCMNSLKNSNLDTIADYESFSNQIKQVKFSNFPWALKYYHMIYPQCFPAMYADHTINRALDILGLKRHGNKRILNMGEISLFIRKCAVNSDIFNYVYSKEWTWEGNPGPSEYAKKRTR